jgi:class 3 adenylate cyclase
MPGKKTPSLDSRADDLESAGLDGAPRGLVAVLFADLVGSTDLLRRLGDEAGEQVLRTFLDILRQQVRRWGGREVKALGDGLLVAFPTTTSALSAAAGMQHDLVRHNAMRGAPFGPRRRARWRAA